MTTASPERLDVSLTVYSSAAPGSLTIQALEQGALPQGYALIRDARRLSFPEGQGEVRFSDVAASIDPTTVSFVSLTDPKGTRVLEQNFQFDLVSPGKLLARYVDQEISVLMQRGDRSEQVDGRLLASGDGLTLIGSDGRVRYLKDYSEVSFAELPGGLITRPTLVWLVQGKRAGMHEAQVSYQSSGFAWWTDYNVVLSSDPKRCTMDLSAWVTLVNRSGGSYPNAQLKLVAGEPNRAPAAIESKVMMRAMAADMAQAQPEGFSEAALFEYHMYTLGRRTDIPNQSTKQLELFPAVVQVPCSRPLVFSIGPGSTYFYGGPNLDRGLGSTAEGSAIAFLEFENRKEGGLGMPLPAGRVRVSQAGPDGALEFIGEDSIKHTPRNEKLRLRLGEAFDIKGERKQVDFQLNEAGKALSETFEITVRNRKQTAADIVVREWLYRWSGWSIEQNSHPFVKQDASTVDFPLSIPADGEAVVRYTVRYRW